MNSPTKPLHISLLQNSSGRLAEEANKLEYDILPLRMEMVGFWRVTWFSVPTDFYTLS